jgi:hypothetical protein
MPALESIHSGPGFSYRSQTCTGSCSTWWSGMLGKQASAACSTFHTVKNNKEVLKEAQKLSDWNVICYGRRYFGKIMIIHVTSLWTRSTSIVCGPTSPTLFFLKAGDLLCFNLITNLQRPRCPIAFQINQFRAAGSRQLDYNSLFNILKRLGMLYLVISMEFQVFASISRSKESDI